MNKAIILFSLFTSLILLSSFQPLNNKNLRAKIQTHVEENFGKIEKILSEISSTDGLNIDVIWSKATLENGKKVNVLVTNGMSEKKMDVPKSKEAYERIELMVILPENWMITPDAFKDENNYWPIRLLKRLARYPHSNYTWFDEGHTIEAGTESGYYSENCKFGGAILLDSKFFSNNLVKFNKSEVKIYLVAPIYIDEMKYKLENKYDGFKKLFNDLSIEIIDINRVSLIKQ